MKPITCFRILLTITFIVLTITFIVLKIIGAIGWSWLWVLSPLWGGWAVALAFALSAALICVLFDE